jgi:acetyl esterase/lipase
MSPMLDERDQTVSTHQYTQTGAWSRESNDTGWTALLGERRKGDDVSVYTAPARATDLTGLPPAFIDVGSAEVFRGGGRRLRERVLSRGCPGRAARLDRRFPHLRRSRPHRGPVRRGAGGPHRLGPPDTHRHRPRLIPRRDESCP